MSSTKKVEKADSQPKSNNGSKAKAKKPTNKGKRAAVAAAPYQRPRNACTRVDRVPNRLLRRFDNYTIAQIKAELKKRDLELDGFKQDLFLRLVQAEKRDNDDDDDVAEDLPDAEAMDVEEESEEAAAVAAPSQRPRNTRTKAGRIPKHLLSRFDNYTVAQIKAELRAKSLETNGVKQDLFMRLVNEEESGDNDNDNAEAMEEDVEEDDQSCLPDYETDAEGYPQSAAETSQPRDLLTVSHTSKARRSISPASR